MFFINIAVLPLARSCACPEEFGTQKRESKRGGGVGGVGGEEGVWVDRGELYLLTQKWV